MTTDKWRSWVHDRSLPALLTIKRKEWSDWTWVDNILEMHHKFIFNCKSNILIDRQDLDKHWSSNGGTLGRCNPSSHRSTSRMTHSGQRRRFSPQRRQICRKRSLANRRRSRIRRRSRSRSYPRIRRTCYSLRSCNRGRFLRSKWRCHGWLWLRAWFPPPNL